MVNDMTERLRRQLEASLTTVLVSNHYANKLPLFKLGLTKTIKLDIVQQSWSMDYFTSIGRKSASGKSAPTNVTKYVLLYSNEE